MNRIAASRSLGTAVLALGLLTARALGQEQGVPIPGAPAVKAPNWGTLAFSVHTVNSFAFVPFDPAMVYAGDGHNGRYTVSGIGAWEAPVLLPTGVVIYQMEIDGCDTSAAEDLDAVLFICEAGACTTAYAVSTGGTPGCNLFASGVTPTEIDNRHKTYTVQVETPGGSGTVWRAVRFFYKLQVSPAPGVATFADVPTDHPFFRFVEALYAAGITGGCNTNPLVYCPNAPVTRGQMAVFLSIALGLHFPN
jgi:hypothetical protein